MIQAVLAVGPAGVSAHGGTVVHQAASSAAGPILIGVMAGLCVVIVAVVTYLMVRAYKSRSRTIESIRRLIQDADAARTDPVLVHQARRRIQSTGFDRR
jgi:hypothetical protein